MENILSAEDFMLENLQSMDQTEVEHAMIEFAKLHVKAALKEAEKSIKIGLSQKAKDLIINSYPLENIK